MTWRKYYWRVLGVIMAGAGVGLMVDEVVNGPFTLNASNHEFWGLILAIVGAVLIAVKPRGK